MVAKKDEKDVDEGSTAHKREPGTTEGAAPQGGGTGPMPMGMLGGVAGAGGKDPDQKSTNVPPKTVERPLPDGSMTYADPGSAGTQAPKKVGAAKAGKYEVVSPVTTKVGEKICRHQPGDVLELDEKEATSLGDAVKPAGR